jgi:hypothetical protein
MRTTFDNNLSLETTTDGILSCLPAYTIATVLISLNDRETAQKLLRTSLPLALHAAMHASGPATDPVPTAGTFPPRA